MEVGGVEPAAGPFRKVSFWLVRRYSTCSRHVFDLTVRNLSRPLVALKPRQVRVAASFPRHVSARTIGLWIVTFCGHAGFSRLAACVSDGIEAGVERHVTGGTLGPTVARRLGAWL